VAYKDKLWPHPTAQAQIWKSFEEKRPRQGNDFDLWVTETAAKCECDEALVRKTVAQQQNAMMLALRAGTMTRAQQLAEIVGAGLHAALAEVKDALSATKLVPCGGNEYKEVPDRRVRLDAADTLFRVHGGYAPQQIQVESTNYNLEVSTEELLGRLDALRAELKAEHERPRVEAGTADARRGTKGKKSANGRLLLADGVHNNEGRSESD
jgi:hypothetical protein